MSLVLVSVLVLVLVLGFFSPSVSDFYFRFGFGTDFISIRFFFPLFVPMRIPCSVLIVSYVWHL
jgi:hypothetical protein